MGWPEMIVAIVLIGMIGKIFQARYAHRDRTVQADPVEALENRQLKGEVQTLKERIAVLERLATDDNSSARLDREIERLRDRPERNRVND